MIPLSRLTDLHVCPLPLHGITPLVSASPTVKVNGLPVARIGDCTGCGAVIVTGFVHILVDGRPMAHMGSLTTHGGSILNGSTDTFGGAVNLVTRPTVVDFAKMGVISPIGEVNDTLLAELLADPSLEQRAQAAGALVNPGDTPYVHLPQVELPEMIAVAGSQHDNGSGNKMMFIGQAVRQLREYQSEFPARPRTLMVFTLGYSKNMLDAARKSAALYNAQFVSVSIVEELFDYINSGQNRLIQPVGGLDLFSHGVPLSIAFCYQFPNADEMALTLDNYQTLLKQSFSPNAKITSFACRTGMGNPQDLEIESAAQLIPKLADSLAQKMADHLKISVSAFAKRSDYKNTWGSFTDRRQGNMCHLSGNSIPNDEWCEAWKLGAETRTTNVQEMSVAYQYSGAVNPVEPGSTPYWAPNGLLEFKPDE